MKLHAQDPAFTFIEEVRKHMGYTRLSVCCLVVLGCTRATGDSGAPPRNHEPTPATAARWGGAVTAPGGTVTGDVLFVAASGAVIAEAPIASGRYELASAPAAQLALVRFEAPVVGVREVKLTGTAAPAIAIAAGDVIRLRAAIELPAGVAFDWVDLEVTPVAPTQPPAVVLWSDAQGSLRAAMTKRHLTSPTTELAVLRGSYRINLSRIVDGPKGSGGAALALDHVRIGPTAVAAAPAGATLALDAAGDARFVMRNER